MAQQGPPCLLLCRVALCLLSKALCHFQLHTRGCCMLGVNSAQGQSCRILAGCQPVPFTCAGMSSWETQEPSVHWLQREGLCRDLWLWHLLLHFIALLHSVKQITQKIRSSFFGRIWQETLLSRLEKLVMSMGSSGHWRALL